MRYELARLGTNYYLGRISDQYKKRRSMPPPRYVIWDCSRRCNLGCSHCGATKERYDCELTTGQITVVIDELAASKVNMFAVTGGEPFLRQDLLQVLSHAHHKGLVTGIATNGFLIDDSMAGKVKQAGVDSVQVSLDGVEKTHNEIRGHPQSFARAVNAIQYLAAHGVPLISVATTVTPRNVAELEELGQLVHSLGVKLWRLAVVMPIGRAREAGLSLDKGQLISLFEFVSHNRGKDPSIYISENLPFLGDWEKRLRNEPLICPAGFTACCIGADGHVRGCPEQPDVNENREGSILDDSFSDIWQRGFGKYRNREIVATDGECSVCKSWHSCYGGCWVMRESDSHCIYKLLVE